MRRVVFILCVGIAECLIVAAVQAHSQAQSASKTSKSSTASVARPQGKPSLPIVETQKTATAKLRTSSRVEPSSTKVTSNSGQRTKTSTELPAGQTPLIRGLVIGEQSPAKLKPRSPSSKTSKRSP